MVEVFGSILYPQLQVVQADKPGEQLFIQWGEGGFICLISYLDISKGMLNDVFFDALLYWFHSC